MGQIEKGRVASIDGATALVTTASAVTVSSEVVVPERLQGHLSKDDEVVFVIFADRTGLILDRADGRVS